MIAQTPFVGEQRVWAAAEFSSVCWEGAPALQQAPAPRAPGMDPAAHIHPLDQEPHGRVQDTLNPLYGNLSLREPLQK